MFSEAPVHVPPPLSPRISGSEKRQRRGYSIRLLPDEHAAIVGKARAAGMSFASYMRACALGDAGPRARRSPTLNAELLASLGKLEPIQTSSASRHRKTSEVGDAVAAGVSALLG